MTDLQTPAQDEGLTAAATEVILPHEGGSFAARARTD